MENAKRGAIGVFSVNFFTENDDATYALDWSWQITGEWTLSSKEYFGTRWNFDGRLFNGLQHAIAVYAHRALLAHFGLEKWSDQFPLEKISTMSPEELLTARREKEKLYALERMEVYNDTLGFHRFEVVLE